MSKHTKAANRETADSCWNKAADDEPIFVLRAHDPLAAEIVRLWAALRVARKLQSVSPMVAFNDRKTLDAAECAQEMEAWLETQKTLELARAARAAGPEETYQD